MAPRRSHHPHLLLLLVLTSALSQQSFALSQQSSVVSSESASSSQPLWSYQVRPGSTLASSQSSPSHYTAPSLMDAFNGLSQRQGALSGSPFLSILPIILIAAGGMLLLLPILTMMIAPNLSGFGQYGGGPFGYPGQVGARKRSLVDQLSSQKGIAELFDQVSSSIEELTKKFNPTTNNASANSMKRAKSLSSPNAKEATANDLSPASPSS